MNFISRYFPGDYQIIPHGIELEPFSREVSPFEEFRDEKTNILFVGRLEKRKGVGCLLKAYKTVKNEFPATRLLIVGPGNRERRDYEKWVKENKLNDVVFTGPVSDYDLHRYYRTADIFSAPAIGKESFGIILLEAMAAGKPIVASSNAGYANVINNNVDGMLVPPKNDKALAQAIIALLNDKGLQDQMGSNGRKKAEDHGWDRIAQRTLDYYIEILNGKRA